MLKYITLSLSLIAGAVATSVSHRLLTNWNDYVGAYAGTSSLTPQFTLAFVWLIPVMLLLASFLAFRAEKED